jgi:hypothetical protein
MSTVRFFLLLVVFAPVAWTQSQMSSGNISGVAHDPDGAVLPSVSVAVTNMDTGIYRRTVTDSTGSYRLFLLPPGSYELRFELPGFAILTRRPIQVLIGGALEIDVELGPALLQQEVLVVGEASLVELEQTQQADTITRFRIENLPINKRDFLDFSLLTPGVTDARALISFGLPQTPTSGLSFAGQSGRSNSVTIDGVDNNDNAVAAVRSTISQEAVQEFQINRSNYSAEFGRASGGLINIVSKSGTNALSGAIFAFLRNQSLDARNPFAFGPVGTDVDPPFSRLQAGFTVGGPIVRNQSFFFLSYEGSRRRESSFSTFLENEEIFKPTASQTALIGVLGAAPVPSLNFLAGALGRSLTTTPATFPATIDLLQANSGVFPFSNNDNTASLRIDHQVAASHQIFLRMSFTDTDTVGGAFGGLKGPSRGANFQIQDWSFVFGDSHFFSPILANEFRFQFANRDFNSLPADPFGPEVNINATALIGRDFFLPSVRNEKRFQWVDNFTTVVGSHEFKFGGDVHYLPLKTETEVFFGGRFSFGEAVPLGLLIDNVGGPGTAAGVGAALASLGQAVLIPALSDPITSLQAFNLGLPLFYQQGFGDPKADVTNKLIAGYIQDKFRVTPALTLNLGFRYDLELQAKPLNRDRNNVAPRVGFAWEAGAGTVVRGAYGVFYSPIFQAVAFIDKVLDGTQVSQLFVPLTGLPQLGISATSAQVWGLLKQQGVLGNRQITESDILPLGLSPGITPPILLRAASDVINPYSQQASFGVERELSTHLSAGVGYLLNRGSKLLRARNTNLRIVGSNSFGPTFGPIDPRILQNNQVESSGSSTYHGMTATLSKRFSDFHQFQVAYTYSKAIDDTVDFITDLEAANQLDLAAERSLSSFDQRQRLVVSGVFMSPLDRGFGLGRALADLTVSPILTVSSGHPFNLLLGFDANGDTNANTDRPSFAGRNTGRGPSFTSLDLRVAKSFVFGAREHRIEATAEAFNLFNTVNFSGVNNVVGTMPMSTFDVEGSRSLGPTTPLGFTSAFAPRQIQIGLKYRF